LKGENDLPLEKILDDESELSISEGILVRWLRLWKKMVSMSEVILGVELDGYFEWAEGYETRFGCNVRGYEGGQKRYPKKSAKDCGDLFSRA